MSTQSSLYFVSQLFNPFTNHCLHVLHLVPVKRQFTYVGYRGYKYSTQVGVIIKREYPGLVDDKDQNGVVLNTRPALEWADYFLTPKNKNRQTAGDRVLSEFWVSNMNFV